MSKIWKSLLDFRASPPRHQTKPTVDRHHSVGPALVPDNHAPPYCEEHVPNIKFGERSDNLVKLQQQIIAELQLKIHDMAMDVGEKEKIITKLEVEYEDMQLKFLSMYDHCSNLAKDIEKKDSYITIVLEGEVKAKEVTFQQQTLTKSLAALVEKQRKVKLIDGDFSITYAETNPSSDVVDEVSASRTRIMEQDITQLVRVVDQLARVYSPPDRYEHVPTVIELSEPRSSPQQMFSWVHSEMLALWVYAVEDVTPEEEQLFEKELQKRIRPPPVYSPHLQKPIVNWARLNSFQHKNLPQPDRFPVLGCSLDAKLYEVSDAQYSPIKWGIGPHPFGSLHGFYTNMGVVAVPDQTLHGYRCCPGTGAWEIDARGG